MVRYHALAIVLLAASILRGAELLTNGGFETGDFTGWVASVRPGSGGDLFVFDGMVAPISALRLTSDIVVAGPRSGTWYALTDQGGIGAYALTQAFVVPLSPTRVTFRFSFFAQTSAPAVVINPIGLDYGVPCGQGGCPTNQHATVDLIGGGQDVFTTSAIRNFYKGADTVGGATAAYTDYVFDITDDVTPGGTYRIRFGEVDNNGFFQMGVDDVGVDAQSLVPEPGSIVLLASAVLAIGTSAWRRCDKKKQDILP